MSRPNKVYVFLRKHVATVSQLFNLTETEQDWLTNHLGHDIRIHREFYRLNEDVTIVTKVAKLLIAVDRGQMDPFRRKTLEEIELEGKYNI